MHLDLRSRPRIPGYRVGEMLGVGGSSTVWQAVPERGRSAVRDSQVAVKVVVAGVDAEREVAVLRTVRHPHVIRLHDVVPLDDDRWALVTDLAEGGSLADLVAARGHLTSAETVSVVAPLARTLADLHAQGVVHGDLAPGNVLLDRGGRPVLGDLGTVRVTGVPRPAVFGTPGYVDPVVLAGGAAGPASDVYGLGAVAWFTLISHPPDPVPLRLPLADLIPEAHRGVVGAVESALDPDPDRRPDAREFADALRTATAAVEVWRPADTSAVGGLTYRLRAAATDQAELYQPQHRRSRPPRRLGQRVAWQIAGAVAPLAVLGAVGGLLVHDGSLSDAGRDTAAQSRPAVIAPGVTAVDGRASRATGGHEMSERALGLVLSAIAADRTRVLAGSALPGTVVEGQTAADAERLKELGLRYRGLRLAPADPRIVRTAARWTTVRVRWDSSAFDVVDRRGRVLRSEPARRGQPVLMKLWWNGRQWVVDRVTGT
ncbi:MAG: serine/threonine protein kinase [Angustibacter sp.]